MLSSRAIVVGLALTFAASGVACCDVSEATPPSPVKDQQPCDGAKTPTPIDGAIRGLQKISTVLADFEKARSCEESARKAAIDAAADLVTAINAGPSDAKRRKDLDAAIGSKLAELSKRESDTQTARKALDDIATAIDGSGK